MAEGTMSLADIAAIGSGGMGHFGGGWMGAGLGLIGGLILASVFGNNGVFGNRGFANAIGYENLATSNEVQRGLDNQNNMANQREILGAVTASAAQGVATTNQVFHDVVGYIGDKYNELDRDILGVSAAIQQSIANQNQCCCNTLRAIDSVNYAAAQNTAAINATTTAQTQKILDAITGNRMAEMQNQINQLQLAQAVSGVVRYPASTTYNAGYNPFCNGCGCGCGV